MRSCRVTGRKLRAPDGFLPQIGAPKPSNFERGANFAVIEGQINDGASWGVRRHQPRSTARAWDVAGVPQKGRVLGANSKIMKHNPLLRRAALLCTLATGGALMVAPPAHAQFSKISEQEEIDAGRQARARAEKDYGRALSPGDPRQQRVNRIGSMFARQAARRSIPYSYTVLQNDKVLNAFAAPGGPIFVTTKLISTTSNDAELAFVLGHETGHIEHRDIVDAVQAQQKAGLLAGVLGAVLGGRGGGLANTALGLTYTFWSKGYSRDQESDADDYGVHAMSRLGFDPRAAVSMMGKLGGSEGGIGKYLSDHPTSDARVKKLTETIRKDNLSQVAQRNGGFLNLSGANNYSNNYSNNYGNNGDVYPPTNALPNYNTNAPKYPTSAPDPTPEQGRVNGTIGLQIVQDGKYRVVLASARDMANYAGGQIERRGRDIVVSRGNSYAILTPGAKTANVNGRRVDISSAVRQRGGDTFAPIGTLADALDGNATYDSNRKGVRLDFENGPSAFVGL